MPNEYTLPTITSLALDARFIIYTPADLRPDGYPANWFDIATAVKLLANNQCEHCHQPHNIATGYMLTVHHLDMVKANCQYKNLVALWLMAFPLPAHNQWAVSMKVPPHQNLVYAVGETHNEALANWYGQMTVNCPEILAALRIVHNMPEVQP